jgi:hypothetical protein
MARSQNAIQDLKYKWSKQAMSFNKSLKSEDLD